MWIDAHGIMNILMVSQATAYTIIRDLKKEQEEQGFYVNPNAKVPVKFFCERYGLDENEVRGIINSNFKSKPVGA